MQERSEMGPETARLRDRLIEKETIAFHIDWAPGAANMSPEERAAMINAVMDECDHPILGLAASLDGEAFLFEDSAHPTFDCKMMEHLPLTGAQKSAAHTADLLKRAAAMLRELAPLANPKDPHPCK